MSIPVPRAGQALGGWKHGLFGDMPTHSAEGVRFYTRQKSVMQRWLSFIGAGADCAIPVAR
ncbi:methylmalonate-semialdehyde dehydrogenase [Mycetohabitans sp. B46]